MTPHFLAFDFNDFKGLLTLGICIMVVSGWLINLKAKKKLQAAGVAFSAGTPDLDANEQSDGVLAVEQFQSVHGLPDYPTPSLWQRISGSGTPMELLFTQSSLIFCDPSASNSLRRTTIPIADVVSARTDYNDGKSLVIKSSCGTIRCETGRPLGAKPAAQILDDMLRARRARI